jgi:hypothetical protein
MWRNPLTENMIVSLQLVRKFLCYTSITSIDILIFDTYGCKKSIQISDYKSIDNNVKFKDALRWFPRTICKKAKMVIFTIVISRSATLWCGGGGRVGERSGTCTVD